MSDTVFQISDPSGLPGKPTSPSESLRLEMAALGRESLYYLTKVILGYDQLVPHVHRPMCEFSDQVKAKRRLKLMPRTHFKTTIWTIASSIQDLAKDANLTILIVADTGTNASRFMREIQQHFEFNELFRWVYPDIIPENFNKITWSNTEMQIPRTRIAREPSIDAIGALGGSESRHYDIIRPDDLVTEKCIRSDVEMQKVIDWAGGLESLLISEKEGLIDVTGSRKKKGDLYEHLAKSYGEGYEEQDIGPHATQKGRLAVFWRRDIENGKPIFPEKVSMEFLMRLKRTYPERYHAQYANSPKGSGLNTFDDSDLRKWRWNSDGNLIICEHEGVILLRMSPFAGERIVIYDPSVAESAGSSMQAILVLLRGAPRPFRICLEAHVGHYPPHRAVDLIFEMNRKWRPTIVSIEHRGFQGAIKYWLAEKAERDKLPMPPLIQWPPKGSPKAQWAKDEHIKGLQPLTRNNLIWLHDSQVELWEQFEFHPNLRYDDGVDAFSHSLDYWPYLMSDEDLKKIQKGEDDSLERNLGIIPIRDFLPDQRDEEWNVLAEMNATGYNSPIYLR